MVISGAKRLQYIYIYMHVLLRPEKSTTAQPYTDKHTHLSLYILLFHTSFYSYFDKFAWDLVKNVTVRSGQSWIHCLENELEENTRILSFSLFFFSFCGTHHPIQVGAFVNVYCICVLYACSDNMPTHSLIYKCIKYSRCIENSSLKIGMRVVLPRNHKYIKF